MKKNLFLSLAASLFVGFASPIYAAPLSLFSGDNGGNPTSLEAISDPINPVSVSGTIGPDYASAIDIGSGAAYSVTLDINDSNNGEFVLTGSGAVGVSSAFSGDRTFVETLLSDQEYKFELTMASGSTLALLGSLNFTFYSGATVVADTQSGQGFGGAVDVLSLFASDPTADLYFTTPVDISSSDPLRFIISGSTTAGVGDAGFAIQSATVDAVPEPSIAILVGLGIACILGGRFARCRYAANGR